MSIKQAIRPDFFKSLPTFTKEEEEETQLSEEEKILHALSQSKGWAIFKEYAQNLLGDLDAVTETAMAQGLAFEEIGRNAIVANLAKGIVIRLLHKVEDAKEAEQKPDGTAK